MILALLLILLLLFLAGGLAFTKILWILALLAAIAIVWNLAATRRAP